MMREFLYIGQVVDTKEWVEGYLTTSNVASGRCYFIVCPGASAHDDVGYQVDPATVRACTGKRDRNGQRIYEGSLCRFFDDEGGCSDHFIEWDGGRAAYVAVYCENGSADDLDDCFCENCEVVGVANHTAERVQVLQRQIEAERAANEKQAKAEQMAADGDYRAIDIYFGQLQETANRLLQLIANLRDTDPEKGAKTGEAMARYFDRWRRCAGEVMHNA